MRISSGEVKGFHLRVPGKRSVRPATNLVRQAIFSILNNDAVRWGRMLDLYAGSGSLGIEALSRRVGWVDFVEQNRKCCDIIRHNLRKTETSHRAHVYCSSVDKAIAFLDDSYDVVFADPPYAYHSTDLLDRLAESKVLSEGSMVVICHANRFPLKEGYGGLQLVKQRRYGDSFISIYRKEEQTC
ncbi:MAG: 16S rRNA (guanine(966)-N(2))-methyltransferase RsmD [Dehalococcoidia bacterium]|nr:16S rRNA (guanine(966)-N(2))-methyltransferase RsmD [Dehalococcoidia bacterium]